jgi:thiol-disulfide isomerase/thioredoxin
MTWRIRTAAVITLVAACTLTTTVTAGPAVHSDDGLAFTGTTLSGGRFDGSTLRGHPAVLWFWTPWCPFCNREAPGVSHIAAANPQVTFVGVAARSDAGAMRDFVAKYNLNFVNLDDTDGSIWARFSVAWQPAYLFVKSDGTSSFVNNPTAAMSEEELAGRVSALTG